MPRAIAVFSALSEATARLATFAEPFFVTQVGGSDASPRMVLALQEIIVDLYDGFLSKEDRRKLAKAGSLPPLRHRAPAPRIKLDLGPGAVLPSYEPRPRIIHFPVWLATPPGVLTWVSLVHETSGHAILRAYGLEKKLREDVAEAVSGTERGEAWIGWFEEAASDCLGVLNLGPAMAVGSIASWRASARLTRPDGKAKLSCAAMEGETHPPPVLRAYLMAHVTGMLAFKKARRVSAALKQEIKRELEGCRLGASLLKAGEALADTLLARPQEALNGHCFLDLQNWRDDDEAVVAKLRDVLLRDQLPRGFRPKHYAAHALAAAIMESVSPSKQVDRYRVLHHLVTLLLLMHGSDRGKKARAELEIQA